MIYSFRSVTRSQREQWDAFVAGHVHGHLLQSWDWGELKASAGWFPFRLALFHGETIVAAAQVLCKTLPNVPLRFGNLAYIPCGPVLDWTQPALCETFFTQLHQYLLKQGSLAVRMEVGIEDETSASEHVLQRLQLMDVYPVPSVQPLRTIQLDLEPSEESLLAQMKEKWRYNVRLGKRKGVIIRVASSNEDVAAWYNLLQMTGERDKFGIHTLKYYQQVWNLFAPQDRLRLLLAEHEDHLLAGIFVSVFAGKGIYLYGASSNEYRQLMPNYVLQWEGIRWAKSLGARIYDFWGIPDTDADEEAMAGVYRFKRGWGGRVVHFTRSYEYAYRPLIMKIASRFL
jgi:peptidoglycan pentaglycine glycine transferase (the first glycine)